MEWLFWVIFGILFLAVVLYVAPAVTMFFVLFRGKQNPDFDRRNLTGTEYEPYREQLLQDIRFFREQKMQDVTVTAFDKKKLHGKYLDAGSDQVAILIHGYRSTPLNNFAVLGRYLYEEKGFNLLFVDNRAVGESEGKFVGFGLKERFDVRTWARYAERRPDLKKILLVGVSMGATSIAFTSDRLNAKYVRGVVLDCGFECPENQLLHISEAYKPMPARLILPLVRLMCRVFLRIDLRENTIRHLNRMQVPALFLHGEQDKIVPFYEGENAYRECGGPKMRFFVEKAGHATAFYEDLEKGKAVVSNFLETYFDRPQYEE